MSASEDRSISAWSDRSNKPSVFESKMYLGSSNQLKTVVRGNKDIYKRKNALETSKKGIDEQQ